MTYYYLAVADRHKTFMGIVKAESSYDVVANAKASGYKLYGVVFHITKKKKRV